MFQSLLSYPSKYTLLVKIGNGPAFGFSHGVAPADEPWRGWPWLAPADEPCHGKWPGQA